MGTIKGNSQVTLSKCGTNNNDKKSESVVVNGVKKKKVRKALGEILGPHAERKLHLCNEEMKDYFDTPEEQAYATGVMASNFRVGNHDYEYLSYGMTFN